MDAKKKVKPNRIESRKLNLDELRLLNIKDKVFLVNLPKIKCNNFDVLEKHQLNLVYENNVLINIDIILGFRWKNKRDLRFYIKSLYNNAKPRKIKEWQTIDGIWVGTKDGKMQ